MTLREFEAAIIACGGDRRWFRTDGVNDSVWPYWRVTNIGRDIPYYVYYQGKVYWCRRGRSKAYSKPKITPRIIRIITLAVTAACLKEG